MATNEVGRAMLPGGRLAFCLGDVSGKGLPASLLMANVQATIRNQVASHPDPGACLTNANQLLYHNTASEKFVTLFYALLDPASSTIAYSNAGHEAPFLLGPTGAPTRLSTGGLVLGIVEDAVFEEASVQLPPGGTFVLCSDGITEAMDAAGAQFGDQRLGGIVREHRGDAPEVLIEDGDHFKTIVGCLYDSWNCNVTLTLSYKADGGKAEQLGRWTELYDEDITRIDIDLSFLAAKNVEFIFTTRAKGTNIDDWAFWLMPRIVR